MNKEIPMLFSTPMVQSIIAGRKTQTRRVVSDKFLHKIFIGGGDGKGHIEKYRSNEDFSPYGKVGDILWVRETWGHEFGGGILYRASHSHMRPDGTWKPSIHMHKTSARIWLQIESIRIERLQDITPEDAVAEGIELKWTGKERVFGPMAWAVYYYATLWDSINAKPATGNRQPVTFKSNPWVWVITFKVLSTTGKPAIIQSLPGNFNHKQSVGTEGLEKS